MKIEVYSLILDLVRDVTDSPLSIPADILVVRYSPDKRHQLQLLKYGRLSDLASVVWCPALVCWLVAIYKYGRVRVMMHVPGKEKGAFLAANVVLGT